MDWQDYTNKHMQIQSNKYIIIIQYLYVINFLVFGEWGNRVWVKGECKMERIRKRIKVLENI